jgi:hypothetical protein
MASGGQGWPDESSDFLAQRVMDKIIMARRGQGWPGQARDGQGRPEMARCKTALNDVF